MIEIELNGAPHRLAAQQDLQALVDALDLSGKALAVAVNREVVPRHLWSGRRLQAQDRVDIVRAIGGG
jgi:sulfur carrier protein